MSQERSLKRYIWMVDTIRRFQPVTREELEQKIVESGQFDPGDSTFSERTFFRDANAIESLFGIVLYFDRKTKGYYVKAAPTPQEQAMQDWVLHTFRHANVLEVYRDQAAHILLEPAPRGSEHLPAILDAIRHRDMLLLEMKRYRTFKVLTVEVIPYFVRLFHQEWYVVARDVRKEAVRIFACHHITGIAKSGAKFELPEEEDYPEPTNFFNDYFGVVTGEATARETVRFKAFGDVATRLQRYPLHGSQVVVERGDDHALFSVRLYPTSDFISELCRYGANIKVLSPPSVIEKVRAFAVAIANNYA